MANPLYLSRKTVATNEWTFTMTLDGVAHTMAIPAGSYYLDGADAESLVYQIDALLEAAFAGDNFTVTYSTTTGVITFGCSTIGGTWECVFNQTEFANWAGFTTAGAGWAPTATTPRYSSVVCAGAIFSGSGRAAFPGILRKTSGATIVSESGVTAHVGSSAIRRYSSWQHGFEAHSFVAAPLESGVQDDAAATTAWAWADFWAFHTQSGEPFRYFTSTGLAATAYEDTYVLDAATYAEFVPQRVEEASDRYWQVSLGVSKYVAP